MLLQVHAKQCQRADCPVPRCKELREMRRRAVVRQEDQRRVAYKNMVCIQSSIVQVCMRVLTAGSCILAYSQPAHGIWHACCQCQQLLLCTNPVSVLWLTSEAKCQ